MSAASSEEPRPVWHVISGASLLVMLHRCHRGEDPELVYVEEYVNAQGDDPMTPQPHSWTDRDLFDAWSSGVQWRIDDAHTVYFGSAWDMAVREKFDVWLATKIETAGAPTREAGAVVRDEQADGLVMPSQPAEADDGVTPAVSPRPTMEAASAHCTDVRDGLRCTLKPGHTGDHLSLTGRRRIRIIGWPDQGGSDDR